MTQSTEYVKSHHVCKVCNVPHDNEYLGKWPEPEHPELAHDPSGKKPTCLTCKVELTWVPNNRRDRNIDSTFDVVYQVYRNAAGDAIDAGFDADFGCVICGGPSKLISVNAYGERHKCSNCYNIFTVC